MSHLDSLGPQIVKGLLPLLRGTGLNRCGVLSRPLVIDNTKEVKLLLSIVTLFFVALAWFVLDLVPAIPS